MKFTRIYILILFSLLQLGSLFAQQFKLGFGVSPQISWLSTNDVAVKGKSITSGFGMGINGEMELKYKWRIIAGANLAFHQGGKLLHTIGGNLWKNSELKIPALNTGLKPLPDNSYLEYEMKYWTVSMGIKKIISESENTRLYFELPKLNLSKIFGARGAIVTDEILTTEENIIKELNPLQLGISGSIGLENRIGRNNYWYTSLDFMKTLTDLTKNTGIRSVHISAGDPADPLDDVFGTTPDITRVSLNVLSIRIGVLF